MSTDHNSYGTENERIYVLYLGLWKYPSPGNYLELRTQIEYLTLLNKYLAVNGRRCDAIGRAGCIFAKQQLAKLQRILRQ